MFKTWHHPGRILDRKNIYSGRVFAVDQLHIQTPDGLKVERDLIKTDPTITILAITADQQVIMTSEYRAGVNSDSVSLPAGIVNPGETADQAAKRELQEETGYIAQSVTKMTRITSSEGFMDQFADLMLIKFDPIDRVSTHFDQDEFVNSELVPLTQVLQWIKVGKVNTAQAVSTVSYYELFMK
ncbi:NUDIX hydrolase [Lentilactobacillus kisonensis]|uniref:Hydrolase, NUDIX family n=1 Tax=Lentilactobacillus kisonensis DSM 19906 = JCM 15041 TaxID=1423766 RepID=A0A0R1NPQ3_9LACO|nr:NUDIX hydrolase [Lentilactobacillus kisonensis]KRL22391.1 hydrolase, NUDIX family [Lentilactobacillus kisonensis DSM 19906 = JCM 15041]